MNATPRITSPRAAGSVRPSIGLVLGTVAVCLVGWPSYAGAQSYGGPSRCCPNPSPYPYSSPSQSPNSSPSEGTPSPEGMAGRPEGAPQATAPDQAANFNGAAENTAAAPSSYASNMFGDSLVGFDYIVDGVSLPFLNPGSGHRFRVADNQSALTQDRFYFNYNYFADPFTIQQITAAGAVTGSRTYDLNRYLFGAETSFWCGLGSIQIQVPFRSTLASHYTVADAGPITADDDAEFDNIAVAAKLMLYRDCCLAVSAGLAVDLPTARDVAIDVVSGGATNSVFVDNKAVILSPFLGALYTPDDCYFVQSFAQFSLPVNSNHLDFVPAVGPDFETDLHNLSFFHFDVSVGTWLYRNPCMCCNCCQGLHSVAAVAEAHYTTKIGGGQSFSDPTGTLTVDTTHDVNILNLTFGLDIFTGASNIRPAVVVPVTDDARQAFDWEFTLQFNQFFR